MDYYQVPIGFGMALSMNPPALNVYSAMTQQQQQAILAKAQNAHSQEEMHALVASLTGSAK